MILWSKQFTLTTLVVFIAAAMPSLGQSQTTDLTTTSVIQGVTDVGSPLVEGVEVGQPGAFFQQAPTTGVQQSGVIGGQQRPRLLPNSRFGDPGNLSRYSSVFGGWNDIDDFDENGVGSFNDGFVLGITRGVYLTPNFRIERESTWRNNSGNDFIINDQTTPFDGRLNGFTKMFNAIRDFGPDGPITPYAGIGGGFTRQDGEFFVNGEDFEIDDWAFAYQAIAGLRYNTSGRVSVFAEYRFFGNSETELENEATGADVGDLEYQAQNIVFGLQFKR